MHNIGQINYGVKAINARKFNVNTYYERLAQGLRQLMAGCRKFSLEHVSRDDIAALTRAASEISGINYIMDMDKTEADKILNG